MARRNSILVSRTLYQIAVVTLITSVLWTLLSVMKAVSNNPTKVEVDKSVLEPIIIRIDKNTLELISKRQKIDLVFEPRTSSSSATIKEGGQ